jgi:hypothetical protein
MIPEWSIVTTSMPLVGALDAAGPIECGFRRFDRNLAGVAEHVGGVQKIDSVKSLPEKLIVC